MKILPVFYLNKVPIFSELPFASNVQMNNGGPGEEDERN
jgi:hypothetical protein